jgi:hypothetical protein
MQFPFRIYTYAPFTLVHFLFRSLTLLAREARIYIKSKKIGKTILSEAV